MTDTIPNVPRDFKKRPVIIQAIKWTGDNLFDVIKFMSGAPSIQTDIGAAKWNEYCDLVQDNGLIIKTLEGQHIATIGDMIIRGVKDEFYPCKPDIFDMTYELSAPSPAGVDGLEVVAVVKDCAHLIGDESDEISAYLPVGTNLYSLPVDAQSIIDGLRGEVDKLMTTFVRVADHLHIDCEKAKSAPGKPSDVFIAAIDQQAQRVGVLEGLLRSCLPALSDGGCAALANRIAATLSAGKEGSDG